MASYAANNTPLHQQSTVGQLSLIHNAHDSTLRPGLQTVHRTAVVICKVSLGDAS
jgi:hypothetical protein